MMRVTRPSLEKKNWQSKPEFSNLHHDKSLQNIASKSSEVEISESLFNLIPPSSSLRFCVDVGTRNGENFVGKTLVTHSLLVSNDMKEHAKRQEHEIFVDNDHKNGQNTWFGVLLQPDDRAFQSLKQLHQPLGNLCLQISPCVEDESKSNERLECILKQHVPDLPLDFDFLGLHEVGYNNYWILRNFLDSSTYRPKVVCISYDNKHPSNFTYIPDRKNAQELPSIRALVEFMSCHDYQLVVATSRCCFFSRRKIREEFLTTRMRHQTGKTLSVSQKLDTADINKGQQQKPKSSISYSKKNTYDTGLEICSLNRTLHDSKIIGENTFDKHHSLDATKPGIQPSKQPLMGTENHSDSLGMKWLLQRRNLFDSSGSNTTIIPLESESQFRRQAIKGSLKFGGELGMETKMKKNANDIQHQIVNNENLIPSRNPNLSAHDGFESRDDFFTSPANTSTSREDVKNEDFVGSSQPDSRGMIDTIRYINKLASQHFQTKVEKTAPPDPIGDTIFQKTKQSHTSNTETFERREIDSKNEIEIRKEEKLIGPTLKLPTNLIYENKNTSIFGFVNKVSKFSQEDIKRQSDEIFEENGYTENGIDDELLPMSVPYDLTPICGAIEQSTSQDKSECARNLIRELQQNGHAMICGTNISRFLCRDALYASQLLLCEANESVRSSCRSEDGNSRGYAPKCTEQSGVSDLKDMVRKFRLGSEKGDAPNIWPVEGALDEESDAYLQVSFQQYHDNLHQVALLITKAIYDLISNDVTDEPVAEHVLLSYNLHDPNSTILTAVNCERSSRHDTGKPLITSHNDKSLMTLLLIDSGDCASIQHELPGGKWENVRLPKVMPNDPIFMLYAGKGLQKLSRGLIPSHSRRIVPRAGEQVVNGLFYSLMPSEDTSSSPSLNDEHTKYDYKELQNPIARLTSDLNAIDEVFQSYVFSEDGDLKFENNFEEKLEITEDPFIQDLEDARKLRRTYIESLLLDEIETNATQQLEKYPSLVEYDSLPAERVESSLKDLCQSSKMGGLGGPEVGIDIGMITISSEEENRPRCNQCSTKLLGSPQLPIVIEIKNASKNSTQISKVNDDYQSKTLFSPKKIEKQNHESIAHKSFLPVAPPWNPPRQEYTTVQNVVRKIDGCIVKNSRKSGGNIRKTEKTRTFEAKFRNGRNEMKDSGGKKSLDQSLRGNNTEVLQTKEERVHTNYDASSQDSERTKKKKNTLSFSRKTLSFHPKTLQTSQLNSLSSSEASDILDEILGDDSDNADIDRQIACSGFHAESYSKLISSSSSKNCDPIFKECREESLSSGREKKIYSRYSAPADNQQDIDKCKKSGPQKQRLASNNYVPFRGSIVELKMRENAKKIRNASLLWEKRGYRFGREVTEKEKQQRKKLMP